MTSIKHRTNVAVVWKLRKQFTRTVGGQVSKQANSLVQGCAATKRTVGGHVSKQAKAMADMLDLHCNKFAFVNPECSFPAHSWCPPTVFVCCQIRRDNLTQIEVAEVR